MSTQSTEDHQKEIERAKKLLKAVRHAAYATINEDGTPHNSPLLFMYNEDLTKLYVGSYSESLHSKNFVRTGKTFVVLFDSFTQQGGVYITGVNAHECEGSELVEALRVHNVVRAKYGSQPLDISYYKQAEPSQRMYSIDIAKIEIYSVIHAENGLVVSEARVAVKPGALMAEAKL